MHVYFVSSRRRMNLFVKSVVVFVVVVVLIWVASYYDDIEDQERRKLSANGSRHFRALADFFGVESTAEVQFSFGIESSSSLKKALDDKSVHFVAFDVKLGNADRPVVFTSESSSEVFLEDFVDMILVHPRKVGTVVNYLETEALEPTLKMLEGKKLTSNLLWFSWSKVDSADMGTFTAKCNLYFPDAVLLFMWKSAKSFDAIMKSLEMHSEMLRQPAVLNFDLSLAIKFKKQLTDILDRHSNYSLLVRLNAIPEENSLKFELQNHYPYRLFVYS